MLAWDLKNFYFLDCFLAVDKQKVYRHKSAVFSFFVASSLTILFEKN